MIGSYQLIGRVIRHSQLVGEHYRCPSYLYLFSVSNNSSDDRNQSTSWTMHQKRNLSTAPERFKDRAFQSPRSEAVFNKLIQLDLVEVRLITELVAQKLGAFITDNDRMGRSSTVSTTSTEAKNEVASEQVVQEKTAFDLKLVAFDEKSKIKVIKEIRAITNLGLKEAKDLVEASSTATPKILKKDIKKEEAEALKEKLVAAGAIVEIA
jgi:large subunit ribosomal protein L7/L12